MSQVDYFFVEIIRFSIIALASLAATLASVRLLNQPIERVRLIQISLMALVVALALRMMDVVPAFDVALLPAEKSSVDTTSVVRATGKPGSSAGAERGELPPLPIQRSALDSHDAVASAEATSDGKPNVAPEADAFSVDLTSGGGLISSFTQLLVYGFFFVSFLNAVYLAIGFAAAYLLMANSTSLSAPVAERVERIISQFTKPGTAPAVRSAQIDVPMVSGVWQPTILLPEYLTRGDADETALRLSLAHELGHIQRFDLITWQVTSICQIFLWIQPCYWALRRELRIAQDQLADQFATREADQRATYAEMLLRLFRARQVVSPGALAMVGGKSNLYRRIELLMNDRFRMNRAARRTVVLPFAALMLFAGVSMTSLQLTLAAPAPMPADPPNKDGATSADRAEDKENPQEAESAEHSGVVIDAETNAPIAGATVTVTRMNSHDWRELSVTESITDENGTYTFTIPPDQLSQRLLYIMFDVDHPQYARRHCGSYGYGMIVANLKHGEQPWFSELKMVRGEKVFGRLVDENGRPVAGAALRIDSASKTGSGLDSSSWIDGVSDQDGRFDAVVTHDGVAKLSIIPLDHCMKYVEIGEKRGDVGDITLEQGLPIHGVVQDAEGNPMEDLWVNLTPEEQRYDASYEMKRSSKTDKNGEFHTRPLKPGKYVVEVERKATGALEKKKYANFHNTPPPVMFVEQTINVTESSVRTPVILRAVPHVLITLQFFKPNGEISPGHSPYMTGEIDGRRIWLREGKRTAEGAYQLMAPHGMEHVQLNFMTNEHSALMVQMEGGELSPQDTYRFDRLEEDIHNIRVVRYPAAIAKINIVDEAGTQLEKAAIFATYAVDKNASEEMKMGNQIGWNREDGFFRLSSIVPNREFSVRASLSGYQTNTQSITMNEGERRTVTITLKKEEGGAQPAE